MHGCACDPWLAGRAPACYRLRGRAVPRARMARRGMAAGQDENPRRPATARICAAGASGADADGRPGRLRLRGSHRRHMGARQCRMGRVSWSRLH